MKVKYLNVFILLVFMLTSTSIFSKEELDITKAKNFARHAEDFSWFLENLAFSVLVEGKDFAKGENIKFKYNLKGLNYKKLLEEYKLKDLAKGNSNFEKLANVMDNFAHRLVHASGMKDFEEFQKYFKGKSFEEVGGYEMLKYSLDNEKHRINCRQKSIILYDIARALGMYVRRVWVAPLDNNMDNPSECHAIIEVWDESLNKWVMLDITNNLYWVDAKGTPLSTLELRDKFISNEKGLKVVWGSHKILWLKSKYKDPKEYELEYAAEQYFSKIYYLKNIYVLGYAIGDLTSRNYYLVPNNFSYKNKVSKKLLTRASVEASPMEK